MKKNLLIIEKNPSGSIGLRKAQELGLNIIFIGSNKYYNRLSDNDKQYVSKLIEIDTNNEDAVMHAVDSLAASVRIDGVMTFMEFYVPLAARAAERLGLPGISHLSARQARDKALMRERFAAAGVASPAFYTVLSLKEALAAAEKCGYPNVLKPVNMAGSRGVYRNDNAAELTAHYKQLLQYQPPFGVARAEMFLLEEFMDGPEFSVESVSCNGQVEVVAVTRKILATGGSFVETGHVVPASVAADQHAALCALARQAVSALGIVNGGSHAEIKLTSTGPKVVEVAARLGGDSIPELVELATGVDLWKAVIQVAMGEQPDLGHTSKKAAAIAFFTAKPGTIIDVRRSPRLPEGVVDLRCAAVAGLRVNELESSGDRLGYAICVGATSAEAEQRAHAAINSVEIVIEPTDVLVSA